MAMDHTVCHFEIPAEEPKRAAAFYRGLFDWDIRAWEGQGGDDAMEIHSIKTVPTDETGKVAAMERIVAGCRSPGLDGTGKASGTRRFSRGHRP